MVAEMNNVSGGGGTLTFTEVVAPPSNSTATLTVDGTADAYIVNTMTDASAYWNGCEISSTSMNCTFNAISEFTYGTDKCKTWEVVPITKGSTVTINFGASQAFKWITAVN